MDEKKSVKVERKHGGKRANAGRPRGKVRRRRNTIWASEEEMKKIREFLFKNRINDPD